MGFIHLYILLLEPCCIKGSVLFLPSYIFCGYLLNPSSKISSNKLLIHFLLYVFLQDAHSPMVPEDAEVPNSLWFPSPPCLNSNGEGTRIWINGIYLFISSLAHFSFSVFGTYFQRIVKSGLEGSKNIYSGNMIYMSLVSSLPVYW